MGHDGLISTPAAAAAGAAAVTAFVIEQRYAFVAGLKHYTHEYRQQPPQPQPQPQGNCCWVCLLDEELCSIILAMVAGSNGCGGGGGGRSVGWLTYL